MVDLIERIGPFLGIAAFLGLAILAFLIFQQAREVRRLRDWAGRAPERAGEAAEAVGRRRRGPRREAEPRIEPEETEPGRIAARRGWRAARSGPRAPPRYAALDRRMPVDPRYLIAVLAAARDRRRRADQRLRPVRRRRRRRRRQAAAARAAARSKTEKIEVAVLNATQDGGRRRTPIEGVPGARAQGRRRGRQAGRASRPARRPTPPSGFDETTIMFEPDAEDATPRSSPRRSPTSSARRR